MRLAVVWPRPRAARWQLGRTASEQYPDLSDALLNLENEGFEVAIEDSLSLPWNPCAKMHEFWSGLDPMRALRVMLRRKRYDAIVCVGCAPALWLVRWRRLFVSRLPIFMIDPALSYTYPRRKRLQDRVLPYMKKVIVFGRSQLAYLEEQYGNKVEAVFVPHRIDADFFCPPPEPTKVTTPYVLSIGNDISRDFATVVAAARVCATQLGFTHRFRLHTTREVAEPGPEVEVTRNQISYPELRDLYRQASVVIIGLHDLIHAGGINSLLEAMSVGRPVIVSASRGVADYVVENETALIVPPEDPQAMAKAIQRLLASPEEAARLGANARRFIEQECAMPVYARRLAGIMRG